MKKIFEVGDLIKGKENDYGITNERMKLAKVLDVFEDNMSVKIIHHLDKVYEDDEFDVKNDEEYFELVEGNMTKTKLTVNPSFTYTGEFITSPFKFNFGYTQTIDNKLPKKYVINKKKKTTVLLWEDGTKTIVKVSKNDKYDRKLGFLTAYFQKHSGLSRNKANEYLDNLEEEK